MHGESTNVVGEDFDFAGVDAGAHIDARTAGSVSDREAAPYSRSSALERRQETIAGGLDLAATKAVQLPTQNSVVFCEEQLPALISQP